MEVLESSSEEGSSLDEPSWVSWFCMLRNHEFFCEVDPAFIQDRFNLYGLKEVVGPLYGEAMTMILGYAPTEKQLSDPTHSDHAVSAHPRQAQRRRYLVRSRWVQPRSAQLQSQSRHQQHCRHHAAPVTRPGPPAAGWWRRRRKRRKPACVW